ncbi:hypothetical protein EMIHUDRAFT_230150 [Emiliania huxleyi CCMP1516]|uniref:RRM domain-containing protein n=2 Tax=Emiliania huxleyi TaxID=2903 RepID=A0A0D3KB41_EMIH1|nr:hypothetical protein EMIHUDRAFT_230150 [Emiliania huxleyi CCMP1516]EOD32976.1 hypothetical protein EMIHUDRAFT_230150 [Emiliania huxleyi CCMP1516]|eukprot:XP_005785405.1 hypothetical protein EMIHUDRAFT_230150 [Emiliania huxleyi CCMP1516]
MAAAGAGESAAPAEASSRICVKGLPKRCDERRLREHFSSRGAEVTDDSAGSLGSRLTHAAAVSYARALLTAYGTLYRSEVVAPSPADSEGGGFFRIDSARDLLRAARMDGNGLTQLVDGQPRVRQLVDPRFLLVNASAHGSPVIDAAFSDAWEGADIRAAEVQASREDLIKVGGKLNVTVPSEEQFKYRLLPTASVPCAYTCRLVPFLSSNSLVVKFSGDAEHYTQAVCGGLRHGVHLLLATRANFGELLHAAVAPAVQPRLQRMVRNANEYMRWATSADGLHCYLHELLSGYARKLNYSVEREGAVEKLILPALGRHARDALRNKRSSPRPSPSPPGPDYKDPAKCLDNPFDFTIPTDRTTAEACAQRRFVPPDPSLVEEFKLGKNRHSGQNLPFVLSSYELPPPKLAAKDMAARCERFWARRPESKAERK